MDMGVSSFHNNNRANNLIMEIFNQTLSSHGQIKKMGLFYYQYCNWFSNEFHILLCSLSPVSQDEKVIGRNIFNKSLIS